MAVDKLVDSAKLNAALNYEANKIIAKGGGTAPLAFDFANEKGFGDYIDAIPGYIVGGYKFTPSADVRSETFTNPMAPLVPKFIVAHADMDDFPNHTKGVICVVTETTYSSAGISGGYEEFLGYVLHYGSDGSVNYRMCMETGGMPAVSTDGQYIRVAVRNYTTCVFRAGVEYTVDLYYFPLVNPVPSAQGVNF